MINETVPKSIQIVRTYLEESKAGEEVMDAFDILRNWITEEIRKNMALAAAMNIKNEDSSVGEALAQEIIAKFF